MVRVHKGLYNHIGEKSYVSLLDEGLNEETDHVLFIFLNFAL